MKYIVQWVTSKYGKVCLISVAQQAQATLDSYLTCNCLRHNEYFLDKREMESDNGLLIEVSNRIIVS